MSKISILTNFNEMKSGYSLTGIVRDQVTMLERQGHEVHLFVQEGFNQATGEGLANIRPVVPFTHLVDYMTENDVSAEHQMTARATAAVLEKELADFDFAFTHDWLFTGWNLPYALGVRQASEKLSRIRWLHWIHSIPSGFRDYWTIRRYGPHHRLVYPNREDKLLVAEQFRGYLENVRVIPHIKDLRTWYDFDPETWRFIDLYPAVMRADIVSILPASVDRLEAKRLKETILMMAAFKHSGMSVCLVVANQWANSRSRKASVQGYKEFARSAGLEPGKELVFSSDFGPEYEVGLPRRIIRELFLCSNLFIFMSREESFGLVVPEAALAGCYLALNKSLAPLKEVSGGWGLYFDAGSHNQNFEPKDWGKYIDEVSKIILGRMRENEAVMSRTFARQTYNMDNIYSKYYGPILAESEVW